MFESRDSSNNFFIGIILGIVLLLVAGMIVQSSVNREASLTAKQSGQAQADSIKATTKQLRQAQIETLRTLNMGDMLVFEKSFKGRTVWIIDNKWGPHDNQITLADIRPHGLSDISCYKYGLYWSYRPDFKIARWNTPEWHRLMADAWKPEQSTP